MHRIPEMIGNLRLFCESMWIAALQQQWNNYFCEIFIQNYFNSQTHRHKLRSYLHTRRTTSHIIEYEKGFTGLSSSLYNASQRSSFRFKGRFFSALSSTRTTRTWTLTVLQLSSYLTFCFKECR